MVGEQSYHNNQKITKSDNKIYDVTFQEGDRDERILEARKRLIRNIKAIDVSKYDCFSIRNFIY